MKWKYGIAALLAAAALRLLWPGGVSAVRDVLVDRGTVAAWAENWEEDAVAVFGQDP